MAAVEPAGAAKVEALLGDEGSSSSDEESSGSSSSDEEPTEGSDAEESALLDALLRRADAEELRTIVERRPSTVRYMDGDHTIPFHVACRNASLYGLDFLKFLYKAWPKSIRVKDLEQYLALHHAVEGDAGLDTLQFLLERYPQAIHARDTVGWRALHLAVLHKKPVPILEFLVAQDPPSIRELDDDEGATILHFAFWKCTPDGPPTVPFVECLIRLWPEAIRTTQEGGALPLHAAAAKVADPAVLGLVVNQWPESIRATTENGWLPIHFAASGTCERWAIRFFLGVWPDSIRATTHSGDLPLHMAAANSRAGIEDLRYLINAWPQSTRARNPMGMIPLHYAACSIDGRRDVVELLIQSFPDSIRETDNEGRLALHLAASGGLHYADSEHERGTYHQSIVEAQVALQRVRFLLERWPDSIRHATNEGLLPLHYAARYSYTTVIPSFLVEQNPLAIRCVTVRGMLPLHYAASRDRPQEFARCFVEQWPESVRVPSADQWLALHHAAAGEATPGVVRYFCDQWPGALQSRSHPDGRIPLHLAVLRPRLDPEVVRVLVERRPESVREVDSHGSHALHMAVSVTSPSLTIAQTLLGACPKSLEVADRRTGLYPALLAASNETASLDLVFTLLVKWPEAVAGFNRRSAKKRCRCD